MKDEMLPFSSVLAALLADESFPIHLLFRLSDMSAADMAAFREWWTAVPTSHRRIIIRHLADLSENNFSVDFDPIFRDALADSDAAVRVAALDGMADSTDTRLIMPIIRLMQTDENEEVRASATATLSHYILLAEWGQITNRFTETIVAALLAEYDQPDTAVTIKCAALEALGAADHPRVPTLIEDAYNSHDPLMQISAMFAMGNSADKRWLATVLAELESPNAEMRAEAARAAGNLGTSDAISPLEQMTEDEDFEVRLAAIEALGRIGGERAHEILLRLSEEEEDDEILSMVDEALEELSLFAGDLQLFDFDADDEPPLSN